MAGTYSQLLLHIVFSTKDRTPWIAPDVAERLYPFMGEIVRAQFLCPSGAERMTIATHGFRCATPVATVVGPSGAVVSAIGPMSPDAAK